MDALIWLLPTASRRRLLGRDQRGHRHAVRIPGDSPGRLYARGRDRHRRACRPTFCRNDPHQYRRLQRGAGAHGSHLLGPKTGGKPTPGRRHGSAYHAGRPSGSALAFGGLSLFGGVARDCRFPSRGAHLCTLAVAPLADRIPKSNQPWSPHGVQTAPTRLVASKSQSAKSFVFVKNPCH